MHLHYIRVNTLIFAVLALLCSFLLLQTLPLGERFLVVYTGLNSLVVFGSVLFFYKAWAGVKKPLRYLLFWALWVNYCLLPPLFLLWRTVGCNLLTLAAVSASLQLLNAVLATTKRRQNYWHMVKTSAVIVLAVIGQTAVLNRYPL